MSIVTAEVEELRHVEHAVAGRFLEWLASPLVLRAGLAAVRKLKPIVVAGDKALVTRWDDVREVLARPDDFGVTEIYADKMEHTSGAFILGMEDTPQYRREVSILRAAVRPDDFERLRQGVSAHAEEILAGARSAGKLDVVGSFSREIPLRMVDRFFGVPGPDPVTMKRWMRSIFWEIFLNPRNDAKVTEQARVDSAGLAPYLSELIAQRKAGLEGAPDDFLSRLLRMQSSEATRLDDEGIRRNVGGVIVGAVDTLSKAIANVLDTLLDREDALASARAAAAKGDETLVSAHVFEALRFNPHNPILFRRCHRDAVIAKGTPRETTIAAGTQVCAATLAAMFDGQTLVEPAEFRLDRPWEHYLHFGHGQHTCFGERINRALLPVIFQSLLRVPGLARAPGDEGRMVQEGPFPDRLIVTLGS